MSTLLRGAGEVRVRRGNIGQVSTGSGGFLYMMISSLFVGLVIVLEAGPVYILVMSRLRGFFISPIQQAFIGASFWGWR